MDGTSLMFNRSGTAFTYVGPTGSVLRQHTLYCLHSVREKVLRAAIFRNLHCPQPFVPLNLFSASQMTSRIPQTAIFDLESSKVTVHVNKDLSICSVDGMVRLVLSCSGSLCYLTYLAAVASPDTGKNEEQLGATVSLLFPAAIPPEGFGIVVQHLRHCYQERFSYGSDYPFDLADCAADAEAEKLLWTQQDARPSHHVEDATSTVSSGQDDLNLSLASNMSLHLSQIQIPRHSPAAATFSRAACISVVLPAAVPVPCGSAELPPYGLDAALAGTIPHGTSLCYLPDATLFFGPGTVCVYYPSIDTMCMSTHTNSTSTSSSSSSSGGQWWLFEGGKRENDSANCRCFSREGLLTCLPTAAMKEALQLAYRALECEQHYLQCAKADLPPLHPVLQAQRLSLERSHAAQGRMLPSMEAAPVDDDSCLRHNTVAHNALEAVLESTENHIAYLLQRTHQADEVRSSLV